MLLLQKKKIFHETCPVSKAKSVFANLLDLIKNFETFYHPKTGNHAHRISSDKISIPKLKEKHTFSCHLAFGRSKPPQYHSKIIL